MFETELIDSPVTCPYDKNHRIARSRIQRHIVRCERNYPPNYKIICPYDATHRLFKSEMAEHVISCPKRFLIEPTTHIGIGKHGQIGSYQYSDLASTIDCDESWDGDTENDFTSLTSEPAFIDANSHDNNQTTHVPNVIDKDQSIEVFRPPRGYAEVIYVETDNVAIEDNRSVVSTMGMGRGRVNNTALNLPGRGRGRSIN